MGGFRMCIATAIAALAPLCHAQAPDTRPVLVLTGSLDSYNTIGPWLTLIYADALGRLGYRFEYKPYPAKRSSAVSDHGLADGEIHRTAGYSELHPDMVRVPVSHFAFNFVAYAARPVEFQGGWQAFKNTPLRVEYRSGITRAEQQLQPLVPADRLSEANNVAVGLRKLQFGRSDVYIDVDVIVDPQLAQAEFRQSGIRKVALIETTDMYAHLNKRHADLAVKLGQVLAEMKKEGLIEKYRVQAGIPKN